MAVACVVIVKFCPATMFSTLKLAVKGRDARFSNWPEIWNCALAKFTGPKPPPPPPHGRYPSWDASVKNPTGSEFVTFMSGPVASVRVVTSVLIASTLVARNVPSG